MNNVDLVVVVKPYKKSEHNFKVHYSNHIFEGFDKLLNEYSHRYY